VNQVGRWSGSLAKDDGLVPIDHIQGDYRERSVAITSRCCQLGSVKSVCDLMTEQLSAVRTAISRLGIDKFLTLGGFDLICDQ
jgi:hypothetical protein